MGLFSSSKSKSVSGPAAYTAPYVQGALGNVQDSYNKFQPTLDALGGVAQEGAAALAPKAFGENPFLDNAKGAARTISNGYFLGNNPGQATYDRMQGGATGGSSMRPSMPIGGDMMGMMPMGGGSMAGDPSMGLLSRAANDRGGNNPADGFASAVSQGEYLNKQPSAGLYSSMMDPSYSKDNPFLEDMIRQTNEGVTKDTNRLFSSRGMGSGLSTAFADVASKRLADSGNALRYQNYNDAENRRLQAGGQSDAAFGAERDRMDASTGLLSNNYNDERTRALSAAQSLSGQFNAGQDRALEAAKAGDANRSDQVSQMLDALGLTGDLENAGYAGVTPTLDTLKTGATLPMLGTSQYADLIAQLTGATNSSTSTSKGAGLGYSTWTAAAGSLSDRRAKTNIEQVGVLEDGLGVYEWDYIDPAHGEGRFLGVIADEVERLRPWALGPMMGDFQTVNYEAL